jgi:uncharacterized membrane protein
MTTLTKARWADGLRVEARGGEIAVAGAAAAWAALFAWLSVARHDAFWTGRFDLGNMTQAIWSTLHGRPLESTDVAGEQISRLAAHVDPLLLVALPAYVVWPDPRALLVVQAIAVALGAFPAYWLARRWIGEPRLALAVPAAYLLYPPIQWAVVTEMHAVTLVTPLLLLAVWAAEERRDVVLAVAVVLALLGKEQVGLTVAALGVWLWVARGRRGAGGALAAGGLAWTILAVGVIQPLASGDAESPFAGRYDTLGGSPSAALWTCLTRPWEAAAVAVDHGLLSYLAALLLPLLLLPLASPGLALVAVPEIALNLLSDWPAQHTVQYHYTAVVAPIMIAASAGGLARIANARLPRPAAPLARAADGVGVALVGACLIGGILLGPLPWWRHLPYGSADRTEQFTRTAHVDAMEDAVALVPPDAPVSAGNLLAAHLSERGRIYTFPTVADAEYVLVDTRRPFVHDLESPRRHVAALRAFRARGDFRPVFARDGVIVFRRAGG